jgi:hypothetical protein
VSIPKHGLGILSNTTATKRGKKRRKIFIDTCVICLKSVVGHELDFDGPTRTHYGHISLGVILGELILHTAPAED